MGAPLNPAFSKLTEIDIRKVKLVLTSAQILALETTPINLVPAQGVGTRIVPLAFFMRLNAGSAAYTDAGGAVKFGVGATALQALASNAIFLTTTSPNIATEALGANLAATLSTAGNPSDDVNVPLTIFKITNNFAAGNGTIAVTVWYVIEVTD
jgi:hypothetical protein